MSNDYNEIKYILLNLDDVSTIQFSRLVDVYGRELVNQVIKDLREVDSKKDSSKEMIDIDDRFISAYDYYVEDIRSIIELSSFEKNKLLGRIFDMIQELNELFDIIIDFDKVYGNKSRPWISDKVEYCLKNCNNKELLHRINILYKEYVCKRDILVENNLKFVIYIIKKHFKNECFVDFNDLIQNGNLGLMRAIETYNPCYDTEFVTYAGYWIKQSIIRNGKKMMYPYKIPMHLFDKNNRILSVIDMLIGKFDRFPTYMEIANYMNISPEKINYIMEAFAPIVSLDDFSGIYVDGVEIPKKDLVVDENVKLEEDMFDKTLSIELEEFMGKCLTEREIFILKNLYGFDRYMSQTQLSKELGISSQRIDQIKKRALKKLYDNKDFRSMKVYLR